MARANEGCSTRKETPSRAVVGRFLLERVGFHSSGKGWGGCPGTRIEEGCAGKLGLHVLRDARTVC